MNLRAIGSTFLFRSTLGMNVLRYLPRFRQAAAALAELERREGWTRGEIETFQLSRLNELWKHALRHVPHYRELAQSSGLPRQFRCIADFTAAVPRLDKTLVRDAPRRFLSERAGRGTWRRTGGSTGMPMELFWENGAHREVLRARYRLLDAWEVGMHERAAYIWGHANSFSSGFQRAREQLKQKASDRLRGRLRLSAYRLSGVDLQSNLRKIAAFRPALLYGYSTAVHLHAMEASRTGLQIPSLKGVVLTSENATPRMRRQIADAFGVATVLEYGACECHFIAGQAADGTLRVREDIALVETLPSKDGWEILLTVLGNRAQPLIRYAIGDLSDGPLLRPARGFAILPGIVGRCDSVIFSGRDRAIHPAAIDAVFEQQIGRVRRYRVHQQSCGEWLARIEPGHAFRRGDLELFRSRLDALAEGFSLRLELVDQMPLTMAGKHQVVSSDYAPDVVRSTRPSPSPAQFAADCAIPSGVTR